MQPCCEAKETCSRKRPAPQVSPRSSDEPVSKKKSSDDQLLELHASRRTMPFLGGFWPAGNSLVMDDGRRDPTQLPRATPSEPGDDPGTPISRDGCKAEGKFSIGEGAVSDSSSSSSGGCSGSGQLVPGQRLEIWDQLTRSWQPATFMQAVPAGEYKLLYDGETDPECYLLPPGSFRKLRPYVQSFADADSAPCPLPQMHTLKIASPRGREGDAAGENSSSADMQCASPLPSPAASPPSHPTSAAAATKACAKLLATTTGSAVSKSADSPVQHSGHRAQMVDISSLGRSSSMARSLSSMSLAVEGSPTEFLSPGPAAKLGRQTSADYDRRLVRQSVMPAAAAAAERPCIRCDRDIAIKSTWYFAFDQIFCSLQVSRGLQLQVLWRIPDVAVS